MLTNSHFMGETYSILVKIPPLNSQTKNPLSLRTTGPAHAWWQRTTAVILIPLALWLAFSFSNHVLSSYEDATMWLTQPVVAILFCLAFILLVLHAYLGIVVVIGDYAASNRITSLVVVSRIFAVTAIIVTVSLVISLF